MLQLANLRKLILGCAKAAAFNRQELFSDMKTGMSRYLSFHTNTSSEGKRLHGKVAIITGGASGIGEATARVFTAHGAKVVIADIQDQPGQKVRKKLGPSVDYIHCDVSKEEDVSALVDFALSKHGSLDIMFNNAGVSNAGIGQPVSSLNMQDFDRVIGVNVRGVLLGVKHAARVMVPAGKGCILCTASINGIMATGMNHPYTISKHAVPGIVKSAASELGTYGIRVNCISPYIVATPMVVDVFRQFSSDITAELLTEKVSKPNSTLKGVELTVEDIAKAALFLASEDGRFMNGHNLVVDGGFTISKEFIINLID